MSQSEALFRLQAVEFQQQRLHGAIVLAGSVPALWLTLLFGAIGLALVALFCLAGLERKEAVSGIVMPAAGLARVSAPQAGVITERRVEEGQAVAAGDVLFVLSSERSTRLGDTQQAVGTSLALRMAGLEEDRDRQQRQAQDRERLLREAVDAARRELRQLDEEIALQQRRAALADQTAARHLTMRDQGLISTTDAEGRQAEALEQRSRLHALRRQQVRAQQHLAEQQAAFAELPLRTQRDAVALARSLEEMKQAVAENEARRGLLVRAPRAGRAGAIAAQPGQPVQPGQVLAQIEPADSPMEAELFVPSRAVGFVKPGTAVLLRYHAFPFQKFGQHRGTVREVDRSALPPGELHGLAEAQTTSREPLYRVRVRLEHQTVQAQGQAHALKAGMQLQASLVLEHRRLYEWVLEPLWTLGGRL